MKKKNLMMSLLMLMLAVLPTSAQEYRNPVIPG